MSIPSSSKRVFLHERPTDFITADTFRSESTAVPTPEPGHVLVRVDTVSLDPAMRSWLRDARSYIPPVKIGETMRAGGLGTVVSDGTTLKKGDIVSGTIGWAEYVSVKEKDLRKITPPSGTQAVDYLGPLGMTGMTAYFGLLRVADIKAGETLVVSGAAGATGSLVCQIGKIKGAKVIGIAGGKDKCDWLVNDLGIDKAYNYKEEGWEAQFKKEVGYLDVFFDNVGGAILDFFLTRLNPKARITLCGAISDYNASQPRGIKNYLTLIAQRAKLEGFIVFDYVKEYPQAEAEMARWITEGKLKRKYHIEQGLEKCPEYLGMLYNGGNTGKLVVQISQQAINSKL